MVLAEAVTGPEGAAVPGAGAREDEFGAGGISGWLPCGDVAVCGEEAIVSEHESGPKRCPVCEGGGWIECDWCEGDGVNDDGTVCEGCEGDEGWPCDECNGTGQVKCDDE